MSKNTLLISGTVVLAATFFAVAYILFSTLNITSPETRRYELFIETESIQKGYDGIEISSQEWSITGGALKEGHTLEWVMNNSITLPGSVLNEISITIFDEEGYNVTANYNIYYDLGTLEILPLPLSIRTEGESKIYDGTSLSNSNWSLQSGTLQDGHTLHHVMTSEITNPGSIRNEIGITILDEGMNDVTHLYGIDYDLGILLVFDRPLTIRTEGESKIYDGEELYLPDYSIITGTLMNGHSIIDVMERRITSVGDVENSIGLTIVDQNNNDVTDVYDIEYILGVLEILPREVTIETDSLEKYYDGTPLIGSGYNIFTGSIAENHTIQTSMTSSITTPGTIDNGIGITIFDQNNQNVTSNYDIDFLLGTLTIHKFSLLIETESDSKVYDADPLTNDGYTILSGTFLDGHNLDAVMGSSITNPGSIDNSITVSIYDDDGNDVTEFYQIEINEGTLTIHWISLTIETESTEKQFDGTPLTSDTYAITSGVLAEGHTLIPVMTSSITLPGEIDNEIGITILSQYGNDVTNRYIIDYDLGYLNVLGVPLTIQTGSDAKEYDGTPLTNHNYTILSGSLLAGHTIATVMNASITDPGLIDNEIGVTIYDGDSNDVTAYYDITYDLGTLAIDPFTLTIQTETTEKEYDGTPLSSMNYTILSGALQPGHTLNYSMNATLTDPGTIDNGISLTITDGTGNDVTEYYDITYDLGTLTVTPVQITIQTETVERPFDGTPLTSDVYIISQGALLPNHSIVSQMDSSITYPGSISNGISLEIQDELGNNVSGLYDVTYDLGSLTILGIELEVQTETNDKDYDGTPLTSSVYQIVTGTLLPTHTMDVTMNSTITYPGTIDNGINISITDGLGNDVTSLYDITYDLGTLTVNAINLLITTETVAKEYDGTPLTSTVYNVSGGPLLPGHTLTDSMNASITDPGSIANGISIIIEDGLGNDVSQYYNITYDIGTLTVHPITLIIQTETASKTYDGTPLTSSLYTILNGSLLGTHVVVENMYSTITDPGTIDNEISIVIDDGFGTDVTHLYDITTVLGTLTVDPIQMILSSASDSKIYDGTPLSNGTWSITFGAVLPTHTLNMVMDSEITDVGSTPNAMFAYVLDGLGNNVSHLYQFTYNEGVLEIFSSSFSSSTISTGPVIPDTSDAFRVFTTSNEIVYFRGNSYGDYQFSGWGNPTIQDESIVVNPINYGGISLTASGLTSDSMTIEYLRAQIPYLVPYFVTDNLGTLNDVYILGDTSVPVSFNYIPYAYDPNQSHTLIGQPVTPEELVYRNFVYANYLALPQSTLDSFLQIAIDNGIDSNSPTLIQDVKEYIQNAAVYNLNIAPIPQGEDIAVYFLTVSNEGYCQHFATAATVMYRAMGIPARYVTGYVGATSANQWQTVTGETAHAWVEVYMDGFGWMPIEVTAGGAAGGSGSGLIEISVKPRNVVEQYEVGKTITATEVIVTDFSSYAAQGYTYTFTLSGSLSTPGTGVSSVSAFNVFDPFGTDVTDQFNITFEEGTLSMYLYEIDLITNSAFKEYDGTPLTESGYSLGGSLQPGHYIESITMTSSRTDVGLSLNQATITIYDASNNDVTDLYNVNRLFGTLMVTPKSISIESGTSVKTYDGTELIDHSYTITNGSLVGGHTIVVVITGTQTEIGNSVNTIESITIYENGVDVTHNYSIEEIPGRLTVYP